MIPHLVFTAFWLCKHCKRSVQYLGTKVCNVELTPDKYFPDDDLQGSSWMMRFPFFSLVPAWYLRLAALQPWGLNQASYFQSYELCCCSFSWCQACAESIPPTLLHPTGPWLLYVAAVLKQCLFCCSSTWKLSVIFFFIFLYFFLLLAEAIFPLLCCSFSLLFPFQLFVLFKKKKNPSS